jgi:hypothetical protein
LKTDTLVVIDSADKINIDLNFNSFETQFAAGYFGKKSFQTEETMMDFDLNFLDQLDGEIQFNSMEIILEYYNSLGIPLKILPEIKAENTQTGMMKMLNTDSVAINYPASPGEISAGLINYTKENSNVTDLIEINPNQVSFGMGGMSNWKFVPENFVFDTAAFYGNTIVKIPLILRSDYLLFSDTITVDIDDNISTVGQGTLYLDVKNGFPFSMKLQMLVIEPISGQIAETVEFENIPAASVDANGKVIQPLTASLSTAVDGNFFYNLKRSKYVVLNMVSSTLEGGSVPVSLYSYYNTSLQFSFEFKFE